MKVMFVYPEEEYLGVQYLSAVLKGHGHLTDLAYDPRLFDGTAFAVSGLRRIFSFQKMLIKQIVKSKPDIVGFSVVSDRYGWACDIAARIKSHMNVPIVFGGIHPTAVPDVVIKNDFVDFVIRGEGEYALLELVDALEKKEKRFIIPNVWYKNSGEIIKNDLRPLIQNLDDIPFPDKELYYKEPPFRFSPTYTIMTGRGCPCACSYCNNDFLKKLYNDKGRYLRRRSIANVIEELKIAKHRYKKNKIIFDDELFTYDLKWLRDFSVLYKKEIGLPSFCWAHPATINEESVHYLNLISCNETQIGVQTLNMKSQKEILNRVVSEKQIKNAIALLKANKILVTADNILGIPGEDEGDHIRLLKFYNTTRPDSMQSYYLRYYPKTSIIYKSGLSEERVKEIESDRGEKPFTRKGHVFSKSISKIRSTFLWIHLIPRKAFDFIIERRIFTLFPLIDSFALEIFIPTLKCFGRKNKFIGHMRHKWRYGYYITNWFIRLCR